MGHQKARRKCHLFGFCFPEDVEFGVVGAASISVLGMSEVEASTLTLLIL